MARWWSNWMPGRQPGGYRKLCLFSSRLLELDCYLLCYRHGEGIGWHSDPPPGPGPSEHHRINVVLRKARSGGYFLRELRPGLATPVVRRIVRFRPDRDVHAVTPVIEGTRLVLSIGWLAVAP